MAIDVLLLGSTFLSGARAELAGGMEGMGRARGVSQDHEGLGEPPSDPPEGALGPGLGRLSRSCPRWPRALSGVALMW